MMQFSQPPPTMPNLSTPPPQQGLFGHGGFTPRFGGGDKPRFYHQPYRPYASRPGVDASEFDGKRLRKSVMRKTVDYNSSVIRMLENRIWQRDFRDRRALQPDPCYCPEILPPSAYPENASNAITTRFVKTATNKMRCPVFCLAWTPEGRRLVTGASSGEFTLWNGLTFNFETILQAHDSPVRTMVWSHNDSWMVTGDHGGYVKYWQSNMNNVKMFQAHKEALRGIRYPSLINVDYLEPELFPPQCPSLCYFVRSFSPSDQKFATCSDDGTIRHGADVKCIHWHPQKGLIISGSKDNQQPVKLWDPKTGQSLATLHAHKSTVMDVRWNENGNWLVTASRDHLLKLFDVRNLSSEVQTFRGHKKEASAVAWHPAHEGLFCSGGSDGAILFWHVGADKEIGAIEQAHDSIVWSLAWHPMGHILCSGSNDHTSKFWTRNRPGDQMRDKYNLNTLPAGASGYDDNEIDDLQALIPGMGPEDRVEGGLGGGLIGQSDPAVIPVDDEDEEGGRPRRGLTEEQLTKVIAQFIESNPPPGVLQLADVEPDAIVILGKVLPVTPGTPLAQAISEGAEAIERLVESGEIPELEEALRKLREGADDDNDDDDANLELRPEEHESYDGDNYGAPWTEQDEMNFDEGFEFGPGGPNMGGPNNFGGPNMGGGPGNFGPGGPGNFGHPNQGNFGPPNNFGGPGPGNFGPNGPQPNMGGPGCGNFPGGPPGNFGGHGQGNFGPGPNMGGPGNFPRPPNPGNFGGPNMGPFPGPNAGPRNFGGPNMGGPGNFGPNSGENFGPDGQGNFRPCGPGNFGNQGGPPGPGFDPRVGPAMRSNFPRGGRGMRGNENMFRGNGPRGRGAGGDGNWGRPPWEQQGGPGGGNEWGPESDGGANRGGRGGWNGGRGGGEGGNWEGNGSWRGGRGGEHDGNWRGGRGGAGNDGSWRGGRGGEDGPGNDGNWRGGRGGGDNGNWRGGRGGGDNKDGSWRGGRGDGGNWRGGSDEAGGNWRGGRGGRGSGFMRRGVGRAGPANWGNRGGGPN
ncbi:hypothetical protein B566_EDAN010873 [Ephemera danica]|nr:hypothetical protein B566_EDAN010873 [Ephemera danica]